MKRFAVIITTHQRVLDAKIAMELIRFLWQKNQNLRNIDIYHAFNGERKWYPKKYLEDVLIRREPKDHYEGAADLIDAGMKKVFSSGKQYEAIIVQSSDVFIIKPQKIVQLINTLNDKYLLATSLWPSFTFIPRYFASEFFIIKPDLARKIFPLDLPRFFMAKPWDLFLYALTKRVPILTVPKVELCLSEKILKETKSNFWSFKWLDYIYLIPNRKIVWAQNRVYTQQMGYYSHHNINKKTQLISHDKVVGALSNDAPVLASLLRHKK